jgi:predicted phage terminase large subunit-like protein
MRESIRPIPAKPTAEKVMRMNAHTARIEAGYVHLPRHAAWLEEFRRELMLFPAGKYDDQIDALSQGLDRAFVYRPTIRTYAVKGLY